MNTTLSLDPELSARFAMTLAHFLWQGAAIGIVAFALGAVFRRASARLRYGVFMIALLGMALCPPVTFLVIDLGAMPAPSTEQTMGPIELRMGAADLEDDRTYRTDQSERSDAALAASTEADTSFEATGPKANLEPAELELATAPPTAADWRTYTPYLILAYLAGVLAMLARLGLGLAGGGSLRKRAERISDSAILEAVRRHAELLKLRAVPVVACCQRVAVPTVVGVVRPMILLPASLATGMPPLQVELLLLHELTHIRRYDHLVNIAQRLVEAALFFHPAVWYVSHRIRVEREHCCDDLVIALGGERHAYAESLVAAAALATGARLSPAALAATGKPSQLRKRIHRLLEEPAPPVRLVRGGWVFAALVVAAVIAGATQVATLDSAEPERENFAQAESTPELEAVSPVATDAENVPAETRSEPSDVPVIQERTTEIDSSASGPAATARAVAASDSAQTQAQLADASAGSALIPADWTKELNDKYTELSSQMKDPDWWLRKVAVQQIGDLPYHPQFVFSLVLALKDEDARVQAAAASALAKQGDPQAIKHLVAALKEESEVREAAAEALTHFKHEDVMPLLTLAARDEEPQVFFGAITALGKQNTADAATVLLEFFPKIWDESYYLARGSGAPVRRPTRQQGVNQGIPFEPGPLGERLITAFSEMDESIAEQTLLKAVQQSEWETQTAAALIADKANLRDRAAIHDVLRSMLRSPQDHVRAAATLVLGNALADPAVAHKELDKETADALVSILRDPNPSVAHAAATVLRLAQWRPESPEDRAWYLVADDSCKEAAQLGSVAFEPLVHALHATQSPTFLPPPTSSRNTYSPMDGLMSIEDPRKVEALINAIELHPEYTESIANMLGEIGDPRGVDTLIGLLGNLEPRIRQSAASALGTIGDSRAVDSLLALVDGEDANMRLSAIWALGEIGDPRAAEAIRPYLEKNDWSSYAASALGKMQDNESAPKILDLYRNPPPSNNWVEQMAKYAEALAQIGGPVVRDGMIDILSRDNFAQRRVKAAEILGEFGDAKAVPALRDAAYLDTEKDVQKAACTALGQTGGEDAARALVGMLELVPNQQPRFGNLIPTAVESLGQIENQISTEGLAAFFTDSIPFRMGFEEARLTAAKALAERGDPRAEAMLEKLRGVPSTRIEATNALQELEQHSEPKPEDGDSPVAVTPEDAANPAGAAGRTDQSDQSTAETQPAAQLPGPRLQFRWVVEGEDAVGKTVLPAPTEAEPDRTLVVGDDVVFYERDVQSAISKKEPDRDAYSVFFVTTEEGEKRLWKATEENQGKKLAIIFDGRVLSAPVVQSPIGKSGQITGDLTEEEAEVIVGAINDALGDDEGESLPEPILYDKEVVLPEERKPILYDKLLREAPVVLERNINQPELIVPEVVEPR